MSCENFRGVCSVTTLNNIKIIREHRVNGDFPNLNINPFALLISEGELQVQLFICLCKLLLSRGI